MTWGILKSQSIWVVSVLALGLVVMLNLSLGASTIGFADILSALVRFDPDSLNHFLVIHQRLPRVLIALYIGAMMACAGVMLQSLSRNPLTSPATLGINAGTALAVVLALQLGISGLVTLGTMALAGGVAGAILSLVVARMTGLARDPRSVSLILAGALVAMLLSGVTHAILLSDPQRRGDLLSWVAGNINHVYFDRLVTFWWIGGLSFAAMMGLARSMTLISLGAEKAASMGVNVHRVQRLGLLVSVLAAASAVAICGPVSFIGLVVPHLVRPLVGARMVRLLPMAALVGAILCLLADLAARLAFQPYTLHTGVVLDLLGGIVFVVIVQRVYLRRDATP